MPLDLNHLSSYSNKELVRLLEASTDPFMVDMCRRLSGLDDENVRNLENAESNLAEAEANLKVAEKMAADMGSERDEALDKRDEAMAEVAKLRTYIKGLQCKPLPEREAIEAGGGG